MQISEKNIRTVQNAEHMFWVFKNALNKETCQRIIDLGENRWIKGKIIKPENSVGTVATEIRSSDVAWTDDDWLYDICWDFLNTANKNSNWNFEISACEAMQITRYKNNGFTRINIPEDEIIHGTTRKLSMTIVLNENYEGGEFEFFDHDNNLIKEKMGTVIVFPSYMLHRVRPVTKGIRYSLVAWFSGQPFV